ncbi:MAG: hypothetical protein A4E65_00994 [Syntrophorhabdus sp. PtaU1.Bin153]|nr:MAG: hypothetical protein A4E65_00994 [Syntrophorhabdus sp. PtaU1.Bin153]
MKNSLEEKRKNRFLLLHKLYALTNGVAERHLIDIRELGEELGMGGDVALDTFEYLKGEGLTKWMALGGIGTITHWGIKEVEDALEQKPTAHFPANIVILTNSPGANVVSGSVGSSVFDQRGQHVQYQYNAAGNINFAAAQDATQLVLQLDLLKQELIKAREEKAISELTESKAKTPLLEAIEEAKRPEPDRKSLLSHLAQAKGYLKDIAALTGLVEAITEACKWIESHL